MAVGFGRWDVPDGCTSAPDIERGDLSGGRLFDGLQAAPGPRLRMTSIWLKPSMVATRTDCGDVSGAGAKYLAALRANADRRQGQAGSWFGAVARCEGATGTSNSVSSPRAGEDQRRHAGDRGLRAERLPRDTRQRRWRSRETAPAPVGGPGLRRRGQGAPLAVPRADRLRAAQERPRARSADGARAPHWRNACPAALRVVRNGPEPGDRGWGAFGHIWLSSMSPFRAHCLLSRSKVGFVVPDSIRAPDINPKQIFAKICL